MIIDYYPNKGYKVNMLLLAINHGYCYRHLQVFDKSGNATCLKIFLQLDIILEKCNPFCLILSYEKEVARVPRLERERGRLGMRKWVDIVPL